jgi:hypothetical protein
MSILESLNLTLSALGVPTETGVFSDSPPDEYIVITPMVDTFQVFADDSPQEETQEARLSLFTKGSYTKLKNQVVKALLNSDFIITDRRFIGHEDDTGFHHYAIDVVQNYELKEE